MAAAAAAACITTALFYLKRSCKDTYDPSADNVTELNDFEQVQIVRGSAPITTLTWLEGDHVQVTTVLKARVLQILHANPWLCRKFARRNGKYVLQYNNSILNDAIDGFFLVVDPSESFMTLDTPVEQVNELCMKRKLVLEFHGEFKQPLWRIAVIPDAKSGERFALILSLSHVAGDGHTFYSLYNMLVGGENVRPLDAKRIADTSSLSSTAMGETE